MSLTKGLVLNVDLDDESYNPSTKRFTDKSAYGNHGTSANAASFVTDRMGQSDRAMDFNGTSDCVDCGGNLIGTAENGFTVAAWLNNLGDNYKQIVYNGNTQLRNGICYVRDSIGLWVSINYVSDSPSNGNWYHLQMTYKTGGTMRVYINGAEVTNSPATGISTPIFDMGTSIIGCRMGSEFLDGLIANVRIYNRVLTSVERTLLYESYRPKTIIV